MSGLPSGFGRKPATWPGLPWLAVTAVFLLFAAALSPVSAGPAAPALVTFTVDSDLDEVDTDTGDGLCRTAAATCTLRAAVMQANAISGEGADIILPAGTYTLARPATADNGPDSGDLNLTSPASGNPRIRISGAGAATTIIDANGLDRAFSVLGGRTATISGVTIANGFKENPGGPAEGGAIINLGTLEVNGCVIRDNTATGNKAEGGGIANGGRLVVVRSTIRDNTAAGATASGGGLYNFGRLDVVGGLIAGNTATAGGAAASGGGIMSDGAASVLTMNRATVRDNNAVYGGAIYSALGHLIVVESELSENTAAFGGGIYLLSGKADITASTVSENAAPGGGGVYNSGTMTVLRSTIRGNGADGPLALGGGLRNDAEGALTIQESTVSENATRNAGGIYNQSNLFMVNSTVSSNDAYESAGGIYNDGTANVYNTTIVFNQADADIDFSGEDGGVYSRDGAFFNLRNTLLAGNYRSGAPEYDECGGFLVSYGRNLIGVETLDGNSVNCSVDDTFGPWALLNDLDTIGELGENGGPTQTHALLVGSNAIDGGDPDNGCVDYNSAPIGSDQRGAPRVVGARCDIGAFEWLPTVYLPLVRRS